MDIKLADWAKQTPEGQEAQAIVRKCVHCGFCIATCPTYQLLGNELDSPRGRIYLIKQVLEGKKVTQKTQMHLDRCLTCRGCETTCPSGVNYGHLIDIGRKIVDEKVPRSWLEQLKRSALATLVTNKFLFKSSMLLGRTFKFLSPAALKNKIIDKRPSGPWPTHNHERKVILLNGCVQPAMLPSIDAATARVLDQLGFYSILVADSGCCGAVKFHLNDQYGSLNQMRANINAWWPLLETGQAQAIVINASGCGLTVRQYHQYFKNDPSYENKAKKVSQACIDIAEFIDLHGKAHLSRFAQAVSKYQLQTQVKKLAFHPPCTLQHGLKIKDITESLLKTLGFELTPVAESHLCCGSAGTYSILQAELAEQLKAKKLQNLLAHNPDAVVSSNIGCISHLTSGTETLVLHWIEILDAALKGEYTNVVKSKNF